jgi:hypothetical protein
MFAAIARKNLSLYREPACTKGLRRRLSGGRRVGKVTFRNADPVSYQQLLGLEFVEVHGRPSPKPLSLPYWHMAYHMHNHIFSFGLACWPRAEGGS